MLFLPKILSNASIGFASISLAIANNCTVNPFKWIINDLFAHFPVYLFLTTVWAENAIESEIRWFPIFLFSQADLIFIKGGNTSLLLLSLNLRTNPDEYFNAAGLSVSFSTLSVHLKLI